MLATAARWGLPAGTAPVPFRFGTPALDAFPSALWARLTARRWRKAAVPLAESPVAGYTPLRREIAAYVTAARGVRCSSEQVLIVNGSQQALDLTARVLLDPGDAAWVEDPGYLGARGALTAAGARLVPVPVDDEGLAVDTGIRLAPHARLAYVSPSHQYPLGVTMSVARRLALLAWAGRADAWVLEDDYDSEFRYTGRPLASLQGLDTEDRVLYLGTFSKTLLPALRLGYLIVPGGLVDAFLAARAIADRHSPTPEQVVLADFMAEGHFTRHVRRMRTLYAERQACLLQAAHRELNGILDLAPADAGMHLVGWLPEGIADSDVTTVATTHGVEVLPLSRYALTPLARGALLLGYAGFTAAALRSGVTRLAAALRQTGGRKRSKGGKR
jgi:GntR family transcriptional regulator/MocR family aminotransferase